MEQWTQDSTEVRIYDLSTRLTNKSSAFETNPHHIEYITHTESIHESEQLFGIGPEAWRGGCGWAMEKVTLTTHSGTHLDAPYHYGARSGGKPAKTIDEVPLRWCYGDGVVLDDVMVEEAKAGHTEQLWESHYWGMTQEYCQIEKLSGLDQLPTAFGFKVMCFPVKIEGASGGWARVVAVYEN